MLPLQSNVPVTTELTQAFETLKTVLINAVALRIPNPNLPFILETDASLIAFGAVLKQVEFEKQETVAFNSQALSRSQRNYSTYERELFAVVKACEAFRIFLLGCEFTLRTDHRALLGIFSSSLNTSSRVVKWVMRLQPFTFVVESVKGKDNVVADALSRIPWDVKFKEEPIDRQLTLVLFDSVEENEVNEDTYCFADTTLEISDFVNAQLQDSAIAKFRDWVTNTHLPSRDELAGEAPQLKILADQFDQCVIEENCLVLRDPFPDTPRRIIVPSALVEQVLLLTHEWEGKAQDGAEKRAPISIGPRCGVM